MSGRFLLDTNIVIAIFAQDASVQRHLAAADEVFVPSIVLGEVYFGARKSARVEANLARIDEFVDSNVILACDTATAQHYGAIKHTLRVKGRPLPDNDIWIAAIAQQNDLILVTRDAHFNDVDALTTETWS